MSDNDTVQTTAQLHIEPLQVLADEPIMIRLSGLQAQSVVNGDKIGVIGLSRGGELALLLGATFPAIKAIVACSPCGLVQAGIDRNNYSRSAWTYHGKPLQQAVVHWNPRGYFKTMGKFFWLQAFPLRDMFLTTLSDRQHLAEATILVENTQGPILLISGDDDQLWPSTPFSERNPVCSHIVPLRERSRL